MGTRYALTVGGLFTGFVAAVLLAAPRRAASDGPPGESRLLIASDMPTRAKVLEALRPLGVRVYDLATMQLVSEAPAPVPSVAPPSADVRPLWTAVTRAIDAVVMARDTAAIALRSFSAQNGDASARVSAVDSEAIDAFVKALNEQTDVRGTRLQGETRAGNRSEAQIDFRILASTGLVAEPMNWTREGIQPFRIAVVRSHGMLDFVGAEHYAGGWVTTDARIRLPDDDRVGVLLDEVSSVPNLRVVGLAWKPVERERIVDLRLTVASRPKP